MSARLTSTVPVRMCRAIGIAVSDRAARALSYPIGGGRLARAPVPAPGRPAEARAPEATSNLPAEGRPALRTHVSMDPPTDDTIPAVSVPSTVPPSRGGTAPRETGLTGLSPAERAAAFSSGRAPVDRAAALRAGSVPVPRKFVLWVIVGFAVLGLGGLVAEHFVGNAGVGVGDHHPAHHPGRHRASARRPPPRPGPPVGRLTGRRHRPHAIWPAAAPALDLTDQQRRVRGPWPGPGARWWC